MLQACNRCTSTRHLAGERKLQQSLKRYKNVSIQGVFFYCDKIHPMARQEPVHAPNPMNFPSLPEQHLGNAQSGRGGDE